VFGALADVALDLLHEGVRVGPVPRRQEHRHAEVVLPVEAAPGFEEFEAWDSRLHEAFAAATHNRLLVQLFTTMNEARDHPLWGKAKRRSFTAERRAEYQLDHAELVAAIDDRDAEAAAAVMRRHLLRIRGALLGADG